MLVFSEGVPRSGKSYDAVKNHILPALKKGRHVYARLNGLNHERIAAYLKMPLERIRELLHVVETSEVRDLFVATQGEGGKWSIDPKFKNALAVVDEVHEFYVGGTREAMPPESEQFFALHGHYGMDILTMTQFYKRVHTAIRYRIERKNTFQKMSALGKKGEGMYRETAYQTVAPDKYEKVGGKTCTYDQAIFPLYHGIVDGGDSGVTQDVYDGGRVTVWRSMALRAIIIVPLGLFSIYYLFSFFTGGKALVKDAKYHAPGSVSAGASRPGQVQLWQEGAGSPVQGRAGAPVKQPTPKELHLAEMSPEQLYVWNLTEKSRIRFTGIARSPSQLYGWVEWYDNGGVLLDQLSIDQVRALDIEVVVKPYGVRLQARDEAIIATAWPKTAPVRDEQPRLYDTSGGNAATVSAANPRALHPAVASIEPVKSDSGIASSGAFR